MAPERLHPAAEAFVKIYRCAPGADGRVNDFSKIAGGMAISVNLPLSHAALAREALKASYPGFARLHVLVGRARQGTREFSFVKHPDQLWPSKRAARGTSNEVFVKSLWLLHVRTHRGLFEVESPEDYE